MTTVVGADGDALHVLLQRGVDDLLHRAVVAEMDDFGPRGLQHPAHDVDGGIMAVEQRSRGHEPDLIHGMIRDWCRSDGYGAHRCSGTETPVFKPVRKCRSLKKVDMF